MRVWLKWIVFVCLVPIVLILLVSALLYIPPVQNAIVRKAVSYASESLGMNVGFEKLRLSFPLNLSVRNAYSVGFEKDTLFRLDKLTLHVKPMPLLNGNISVQKIHLESLSVNTGSLINGMSIDGRIGDAYLHADSILLNEDKILLNKAVLSDANVHFIMCDTVSDTTSSDAKWKIELKEIDLKNIAFSCRMPCDSIYADVLLDKVNLSDGLVDLAAGKYSATRVALDASKIFYGTDLGEPLSGLDFSHISFSGVHLLLDSLCYAGERDINAIIRECNANERSGLVLSSITGRFVSDNESISVPLFHVKTANSDIAIRSEIPWTALDNKNPEGSMMIDASASIDKKDAIIILGEESKDFQTYYPDTAFTLQAFVNGNIGDLRIQQFEGRLPGALKMNLSGSVRSVMDERNRSGQLNLTANTRDIDFLVGMLPSSLQSRIKMPDSMRISGDLTVDKGRYSTKIALRESKGIVSLTGEYDIFKESYEAVFRIDSLEPVHFMPSDSIMSLTAFIRAKGRGNDFYKSSTWAEIDGRISDIHYGGYSISDVSLSGTFKKNHLQARLVSEYPFVRGSVSLDGDVRKGKVSGMLIADVDSLDFYGLHITEAPLATSFQIFSEVESDLEKTHSLDLTLGNWYMMLENQTVQPKTLTLSFRSNADTTRSSFHAGDMGMVFTANADLGTLSEQFAKLYKEAEAQYKRDSMFDWQELRHSFPDVCLKIDAARDNPIYNFLQEQNIFFEKLAIDADLSPEKGVTVEGSLFSFVSDTFKIDTIRFDVWQDSLGLDFKADVVKNRFRRQEAFRAGVDGYLHKGTADAFFSYTNGSGQTGFSIGLNAEKVSDGFDFHLYPENPVLMFLPFSLNSDNYFHFKSMKEMAANLRLEGKEHASLWIHSDGQSKPMNEILVEANQINLSKVSAGFPDMPALDGLLNMTLRYEPTETSFMVVADANVDELFYEKGRVGELLLNATYMPMERGAHQVDMHLFHDQNEISSLSVLYKEGRYEDKIDGIVSIERLPLQMLNPMVPQQMAQMKGALLCDLKISGTDKKPVIDGTMQLDSATMYVVPTSTNLRFENKKIRMNRNRLQFKKYHIYALGENPFVIDGTIDATNVKRPTANLKMTATNLQLINARKTSESLAYGKLFVNINSTLTGPLQMMRMRGNMRMLGNTNMTYVMLDSPLEVQDSFNDLVTFTFFADTLPRRTRRPFSMIRGTREVAMAGGIDVLMTIRIDPVVRIKVDLDEEGANHVELKGGGDLSFQYTQQGDMTLNGRYTISNGSVRYNIPVIPLTEFAVRDGSYVDWSGNPMNPYLNITAYTKERASVKFDGHSRMVDFNAGIQVKDNLENMSLKFLLEAPNDISVQNQLVAMGEEERSKQAISLLVAGVYLASEGTGNDNVDVSAALSSLLQREINNMLGSLMGEMPFSFDVNTYDGTNGMGRRIDYAGRFYKGFLNERLYTTLGLRYSTKDPVYGNQLILDDVALEYRLDTDGARSVKLFRNKNYESIFEGEIAKIGGSYILHRKVKRLRDLFIFKKQKPLVIEREEEEEPESSTEEENQVEKEAADEIEK